MAMRNVFFKEHEGINVQNSSNGTLPALPRWRWLGSQPPAVAYGGKAFAQSSLELSVGGNIVGQFNAAKETDNRQAGLEKENTTHFNIFSGCKMDENGEKTVMLDYRPFHEIGFGQVPLVCAKYPYGEQCYGISSQGRIMLPLNNEGTIFVNAKQYSGILRRRKKRAAAQELENKIPNIRKKSYMHQSRHLHALRRARDNDGRFLNTKNLNNNDADESISRKATKEINLPQKCEVVQSNAGIDSNESRYTCPGSEVSHDHLFPSTISPFHMSNFLCQSFW